VRTLRIGTRRSALALAQSRTFGALLSAEGVGVELVPMSTSGDEGTADASSSPAGMKGLWIDSILDALRAGEIDLAVHSAKDLPADDDPDIAIAAVPARADPRDVLLVRTKGEWLRPGVRVGTSSLRRRAQVLAAQPGARIVGFRGNVDTRLRKLEAGEVDATVLAAAGLARLGVEPDHATWLGLDLMLPAPGQGTLAVQCRADARDLRAALALLDDRASRIALTAERALMRALGGGCALPLGALAVARGDTVRLAARVLSPDGSRALDAAAQTTDPLKAARMVARQLQDAGADDVLALARTS
jgi:hydroxymethylbilane synthase